MRATDNIRRNWGKTSQEPHSRCRSLAQEKDVKHSGSKTVLGLKEWAVNVAALRSGDQTILLRKGGIRESAFSLQADSFFLIPNTFHSNSKLLKPEAAAKYKQELYPAEAYKEQEVLTLDTWATVTGLWTTNSIETLSRLDKFHIWDEAYIQNRLSWRKQSPVSILELQCSCLQDPIKIQNSPEVWGCFSFAELPDVKETPPQNLQPVLPEEDVWEKQKGLRTELCRSQVQVIFS